MLCFGQKQSITTMATQSFLMVLILSLLYVSDAAGLIGVNYGRIADNLPPPSKVVELLKSQGIDRIKLYDTDSSVLTALAGSNISIVVALPNQLLSSAAASQSFTDDWVKANIAAYHPVTAIKGIAVGNEVFVDPNNTTKFLVPAMTNMLASLEKANLNADIKISSPVALSALNTSYPPSTGAFKPELVGPVIKPMLEFLRKSGSPLMVNAYPFFAYAANAKDISLDYALFRNNPGVVDSGSGLKYTNLLDAQLDAVFAAMKAIQYDDVKVVVTETGWPSKGDENEVGAGEDNAASYNGNLVSRVLTGNGTPLRPNEPLDVYLFALFNENSKPGPTSERNYGLFYPDEQKVYDVPLTLAALASSPTASMPANGSKAQVPTSGDVAPPASGQTWCVANGEASEEKLQAALDYACGEGGADCSQIQVDATCYNPNTLEAHASYAFNSYYQKKSRATGTCDFGGAAYVVTQAPKFGQCQFPTRY